MRITLDMSEEEKYKLVRSEILKLTEGKSGRCIVNIVRDQKVIVNKKGYPIKDIVKRHTSFLDQYNPILAERAYCFYHNIQEVLFCKQCQQVKVKYLDFTKGYQIYCSTKCSANSLDVQQKYKEANLEKRGVENPMQCKEVREKGKRTNLERRGVENPAQSKDVQEKMKHTNLKNNNVKYPMQSKDLQEKFSQSRRKNFYNSLFEKDWFNDYEPLFTFEEYNGVKEDHYEFKHRSCGHIFYYRIADGQAPRCPKCYPLSISQGERELVYFVEQYSNNITLNNRYIIKPKELDVFLPDYNLAIEFDGIYWHSIENGKDEKYHINKTINCQQEGIKLIHVFENEWAERQDAVKSLILENINQLPEKINKDDCIIKKVEKDIALNFLNVHNICITKNHDLCLGLYHNDRLVSYMGIVEKKSYSIINNYCDHNFIEINSLPVFIDYLKDKTLKISSDLRFNKDKLFKENGFKEIYYIVPQLHYINNSHIYDCGYMVYQYN